MAEKQTTALWNQAARNAQKEHVRGAFLTKLFLIPINKGIKQRRLALATENNKEKTLKILKVDAWNEGIDLERNILTHLREGNQLYGMDVAYETCFMAKKNTTDIHVSNGSIEVIPFKSNSFDVLLDLSTSDHLPREKIRGVFGEYQRVLQKKGVVILVFDWWGILWKMYMFYLEKIRGHDDYFFKNSTVPSRYIHPIGFMKKTARKQGFKIKKEYCIDYTGWMWNRVTKPFWMRLSEKGYDKILKLEYSRISKYLRPFAKQYVLILEKE